MAGRRGTPGGRPTVAVVGGGIAGLAAAWELSGGAAGPGPATPQVIVLESADRAGGKLRTEEFGGRPVDMGPDGFLGRRPEAAELCREVGLGDDLVPIAASGAAVWVRGRRRALPRSLSMGVPTRFLPAARSGILGPAGSLRLLVDVVAPRTDTRGPLGDRAIGPLVSHKLGQRVVDRLVDPMIGGIHAAGVEDMSTAAAFPLLLAVAQRRTGFMRALRQATAAAAAVTAEEDPPPPMFWSLEEGMGSLADRLLLRLGERGVTVRTASPVELIDRHDAPAAPWALHTRAGPVVADGIVLAVPAGPAADLLAPHDAEVATLLRGIDHASVAVVTLEYPDVSVPGLSGTGLLVPRGTPVPSGLPGGGTFLTTACSFLDAKWPHLGRPGTVLLRASVGRFGDDRALAMDDRDLIARVGAELEVVLGTTGPALLSRVTRWPNAFAQYRVHHLLRVAGIEAGVGRLPAVTVAGAAYRGVGIPACVAGGREAARSLLAGLGATPLPGPGNP